MMRRFGLGLCAVALALAPAVAVATDQGPAVVDPPRSVKSSDGDIRGTVARIDEHHRVIIFDDQRMFRLTEDGAILVENQPVALTTLRPGSQVVIRSGEPVTYREGQYVVIHSSPSALPSSVAVTTPGVQTTTVTTTTTTVPRQPVLVTGRVDGRVSRVDATHGVFVLDDGRMFVTGPSTVFLVDGHPVAFGEIRPGMNVVVSQVNPVVYRDGRYVQLNQGFFDEGSASPHTWDAKFHDYDVLTGSAAMDVQVGGGGV
jgi:hypothetical protein